MLLDPERICMRVLLLTYYSVMAVVVIKEGRGRVYALSRGLDWLRTLMSRARMENLSTCEASGVSFLCLGFGIGIRNMIFFFLKNLDF